MSQTQSESGIDRRTFLRRSGAGAIGTVGVIGAGSRLDHSPVGNAEAIAPIVIGGAVAGAGASAATGWALREYEVIGSDDPPEGLTPDALEQRVYETARTRKSTNASTFVDNMNILDGVGHAAYGDGKIAAIEALNDQESESEVQDAGIEGVNDYETTIKKNLLKGWNESVQELETLKNSVEEHDEVDDWFVAGYDQMDEDSYHIRDEGFDILTTEVELPDGENFEVYEVYHAGSNPDSTFSPLGREYNSGSGPDSEWSAVTVDEGEVVWLRHDEWTEIYDKIEETFDDVRDGIITWVEGVYGDVQSGELDTEDLLTPRELAEMTADEEDFDQAIADLMALNISVDLEREAEVYLPDVGATIYGSIATTDDGTLETGTYDPEDEDATYFLSYDISQGEGEWSAYDDGVDGGTVTFTEEPFEETVFFIDTVAGETAEVEYDDFSEEEEDEEWTVDIGDQLDDSITEIDVVEFYATVEETQYETIQLSREFEIVTFRDSDGEEYEGAEFTRSEPQSDDNYITEEEWQEQQERYEDLIEQYEDAQNSGGISLPGFDEFDDLGAGGLLGGGAVALVVIFALIQFAASLNPVTR